MNHYNKYNDIKYVLGNSIKKLHELYNKLSDNNELEFIFDNIDYEKYINVKTFLHNLSKMNKLKLQITNTLDIIYSSNSSYRLTILDTKQIVGQLRIISDHKNHIIYKKIMELIKNNTINGTIIKKTKHDMVILDDLNLKMRLASENHFDDKDFDKISKLNSSSNIIFRHKKRISLNNNGIIIDLTISEMSSNIKNLNKVIPKYELETEIIDKKISFDDFLNNLSRLIKIVQQNNYIMPTSLSKLIINEYYNILQPKKKHVLDLRNTKGLEKQDLLSLRNEYCVTDKADGQRHLLIVYDKCVFLLSSNLIVFNTGIILDNNKYDGTLCDGELLYIAKHKKHLYLMFDCLFIGKEDIRKYDKFENRLQKLDLFVSECFISEKQKGYIFNNYNGEFNIDSIIDHHNIEIDKFVSNLNYDLNLGLSTLIRRKYFVFVYGGDNSEIYKYTMFMWNKYKNNQLPYELDGLIFQPQNQEYIVSNKCKPDLKWKPANRNSIDFFIQFHKNNDSIDKYFDDSDKSKNKDSHYKICNLYVGHMNGDNEIPVIFHHGHNIKLYINNGDVRDSLGLVIKDSTVVEFIYDNDNHTWIPLKTRYDKTYNVLTNNKGFGNYETVAESNWRSIIDPVTMNIFETYSNNIYDKHSYYDKITNIAKPMRSFHNWIKETMINIYCSRKSVVDIACGRGGDIMKFYNAKVNHVLGIDSAYNNLHSPIDGAIKRYENMKISHPDVQDMKFLHFDITDPITNDLGKFDVLNCQFAVHYFLETSEKWENFCNNINLLLNIGGYALFTTFDGDLISKIADELSLYIIMPNGDKQKLYEITKINDKIIMVYNSLISNVSINEMIVIPSFFINELKNKSSLQLVETGLFEDAYNNNRDYFNINKSHPVSKYYNMDDNINKECFKITRLNRYYVFKKIN